jgi:Rrf2 family nitric oxide-sensitive transcriptional repressor
MVQVLKESPMLSQTTEYALRAMACLAYSPDELTPTPRLAEHTLVPPNYLAKVLQSLAQADLITGRRGVGGGYRLARAAEDISLLDVVNAIDPVERIHTCPLGLPNHGPNLCSLHRCVDDAARQFIESFQNVRLSDLIAESNGAIPLCDTEMARALSLSVEGEKTPKAPGSN